MDVQAFFQELGDIFNAGRVAEVDGFLRQSLARAKSEGDAHASVSILNEMVGYYRSVSNFKDAMEASELAMREMTALGYGDTVPFGTTLLNAATAYRFSGDKDRALQLYSQALEIFQRDLPENDSRLAGLYNNISSLYGKNGEHEKEYELLRKAAAILAAKGEAGEEAATVQTNMGMALFKLNREAEALEALDKAMAMFEPEDGASRRPPHYAAALAGMGEAYFRMKKYNQAAAAYESALEHIRSCFGENMDFVVTSRNCAVVYDAMGREDKAADCRKAADEIRARLGGGIL